MKITEVTLSLRPSNSDAKEFMNDFEAMTQEHPFNGRARVFSDHGTVVELSPFGKGIHLSDIVSFTPRSGGATSTMQQLMSLADKHKVPLELTAKAYSDDKERITDTKRLVQWYLKLGFEIDSRFINDINDIRPTDDVDMIYRP